MLDTKDEEFFSVGKKGASQNIKLKTFGENLCLRKKEKLNC